MATKITLPITIEELRKEACKYRICDLSFASGIDESILCNFRSGRKGMNSVNIIKLINFLYYDNKTESRF